MLFPEKKNAFNVMFSGQPGVKPYIENAKTGHKTYLRRADTGLEWLDIWMKPGACLDEQGFLRQGN